ncbi:hypothetical protein [Leucobacter aridicollis]|uniref:hypothetical protein n=1 Tax=Leucobacter aridicollis TaxID=283878 RepID=UPI0021020AD7|nr:hypothetical protein [Leucobacter aridicollis]UTX52141.1 hypothetical protein KI794_10235 [Leucobacter aridicollis]
MNSTSRKYQEGRQHLLEHDEQLASFTARLTGSLRPPQKLSASDASTRTGLRQAVEL